MAYHKPQFDTTDFIVYFLDSSAHRIRTHFTARCYAERGYAAVSRPSVRTVRPSVRLRRSGIFLHCRLEYFENNFTAD